MKRCSKCNVEKSLGDFGSEKATKDGKRPWCKECVRSYDSIRNAKPEIKARVAERNSQPEVKIRQRDANRKYYAKPENKLKKSQYDAIHKALPEVKIEQADRDAKRNSQPEIKARHAESSRRYRLNHPEKKRAHHAVERAIKSGKLQYPTTCDLCGSVNDVQYHHDDYSKPLDIIPLCSSGIYNCHSKRHKQLNSEERC